MWGYNPAGAQIRNYTHLNSAFRLFNIILLTMLCLWIHSGSVKADIELKGQLHVGDDEMFQPEDPIYFDRITTYPTHFHLTREVTLTAVHFQDLEMENSNGQPYLEIDGTEYSGLWNDGTDTLNLDSNVTLSPGLHTLAMTSDCLNTNDKIVNCGGGGGNKTELDLAWSSLTLITQGRTSNSKHWVRRNHIGDNNDDDDDYDDLNDADMQPWYYPDAPDDTSLTWNFTLSEDTYFDSIWIFRLREVDYDCFLLWCWYGAEIYLDGNHLTTLSSNSPSLQSNPYSITLNQSLEPGEHSITIESIQDIDSDDYDDISWDSFVFKTPISGGGVELGRFNAVEVGTDAIEGPLYTKISDKDFSCDLTHFTPSGNLQSFQGEVDIELVDATSGPDCQSLHSIANLGVADFNNTERISVSGLSYENALGSARIRITESDPPGQSEPEQGCSQDTFTIRPAYLTLNATDRVWESPGTNRTLNGDNPGTCSATGGNQTCHKAGKRFTLRGTARNYYNEEIAQGYSVTVDLNGSLNAPSGGTLGNHTPDSVSYSGSDFGPTNAIYEEVGLIDMRLNDKGSFAALSGDQQQDCISGSSSNTQNSEGKYGCQTATQQDRTVGRFVPDHFRITNSTAASFCNACFVGAFTYIGQPFYYRDAPTIEIEAVNAQNDTTRNYDGAFWKFGNQTDYLESRNYTDQANASALLEWNKLDNANATDPTDFDGAWKFSLQGNDCYSNSTDGDEFHYQKNGTEDPFSAKADLNLNQTALTDQDGICYEVNGSCSDYTVEDITGANLLYGRAVAENAYGSELLPLKNIGLQTEYYDGSSFKTNTNDTCTVYNATDIAWSNAAYGGEGNLSEENLNATNENGDQVVDGVGYYTIHNATSKTEGPGKTGYVDYRFPVPSWLKFDWNDNGTRGNPPARATFGIYKGSEYIIYQQETTWK